MKFAKKVKKNLTVINITLYGNQLFKKNGTLTLLRGVTGGNFGKEH